MEEIILTVNNLWILLASLLVFIMHLGFATLEAGLTRAKNSVNILYKNLTILAVGSLCYALIGFGIMYPSDWLIPNVLGWGGLGLGLGAADTGTVIDGVRTYWADFIFQVMFAVTAGTIVSGAVAERIRLPSFCAIVLIYITIIYPIVGSWTWGGGLLSSMGFYDFAGSTIVHSVGGWCALAVVILLGARYGKYKNGKMIPIFGHNIPLAFIGAFLLWFGWFGFNGGSVLSADPQAVSHVVVVTMMGACAGVAGAILYSMLRLKTLDLTMILNGILAGLVSVTAGADTLSPIAAIIAGLVAGVLVIESIMMMDRVKLDDPVGAISVHLVVGIWGTLAVGIFSADHSFLTQLLGVVIIGAFSFITALVITMIVRAIMGLRVSREDELRGLDIVEHKSEAYKSFQVFTID